jgi:hypothetical protein
MPPPAPANRSAPTAQVKGSAGAVGGGTAGGPPGRGSVGHAGAPGGGTAGAPGQGSVGNAGPGGVGDGVAEDDEDDKYLLNISAQRDTSILKVLLKWKTGQVETKGFLVKLYLKKKEGICPWQTACW